MGCGPSSEPSTIEPLSDDFKKHSLSSLDSDDTLTDSEQSRIIDVLCQEELLINWADIQNTINEDAMKTVALMNKYVQTWKRNSQRSIRKRTESIEDKDPPPLKSEKIIMDEAPPPGVVEQPATPEPKEDNVIEEEPQQPEEGGAGNEEAKEEETNEETAKEETTDKSGGGGGEEAVNPDAEAPIEE